MLGVDEQIAERWRREQEREKTAETRRRLLAEELKNHAITVEPDAGRDISNLEAQLGRPLSAQQVIAKLRKCNPALYFEISKSDPSKYGVYIRDPRGAVLVTPGGEVLTVKHVMGMEAGIVPEFSVIHKTTTRAPNAELFGRKVERDNVKWKEIETFASETRGWRTVVVRLLRAGLITEADVHKHFGWQPSHDSRRWHEQTR